jgi:hypothetical protein
VGKI